ncbi:kinase domain protein [Ancylostoma caninum]|uniref:non-specific serine/threonine protein kinase n=1 Tax=Ancylostoma caninum TaxID=29170 RepID=A0A368GQS5_ANCCA|nr:kinase domain protein [Ancylostoma caninum]
MDMGVLAPAIDLQIAEEVIDEESQVNVGPSSQYEEVRSEVPGNRLQARSQGSSNQLKLSVGGEEDSPEEDDINQLRQSMHMWHLHEQESEEFAEIGDDVGLSAERVQSIIAGQGLLFPPLHEGSFVEEVFSEKGPKSHNGYLFGAKIGEGSYAKVKEVVDETTLVRRAVKIIKHSRLRKIQNGQENVERELRILNKVKHENVIRLIEVFRREQKNKLYVVLEFCMGSVQQLLDAAHENRLSDAETHRYFVDLIKGLEYLHSVGIVHKDIKPANLLVSLDYKLKISDFGVAEELSQFQKDDSCQVVQGTPKFQAPELVSGNTESYSGFASDLWSCGVTLYNMISGLYPFEGAVIMRGFASDLWSCGVTLYNMISGLYPFEGAVIMRLFDNIAHADLVMPTNVELHPDLVILLKGLLNKEAKKRFTIECVKHNAWHARPRAKFTPSSQLSKQGSVQRPLTVYPALEERFGAIPLDRIVTENDLDVPPGSLDDTVSH